MNNDSSNNNRQVTDISHEQEAVASNKAEVNQERIQNDIINHTNKDVEDFFVANYLSFFSKHISSVSAASSSTDRYKSYSSKPKLSDYTYKTEAQLFKEKSLKDAKLKEENARKEESKNIDEGDNDDNDNNTNDDNVNDHKQNDSQINQNNDNVNMNNDDNVNVSVNVNNEDNHEEQNVNNTNDDGISNENDKNNNKQQNVTNFSKDTQNEVSNDDEQFQQDSERKQSVNSDPAIYKPQIEEPTSHDVELEDNQVDYLAYGLAYFLFKIEQYLPVELDQNPHQKFRYAKLMSNFERIYVNLGGSIIKNSLKEFSDLVMWRNRLKTFTVLTIYLIIILSDMLLNCILVGMIAGLGYRKLCPPSSESQLVSSKNQTERAREVIELEDDFGLNTDGKTPPGKREKSMREAYKMVVDSKGREIQLVSGDLADFIEKIKNLYLWRNSKATRNFILRALIPSLIGSQFISHAALTRCLLSGLGLLVFVFIPLSINYPRYRRISWNMPDVPTDAQYALSIMRNRVRNNEPLPVLIDPFKVNKKEKKEDDKNKNKDNEEYQSNDELTKSHDDQPVRNKGSKWSRMANSLQRGGRIAERGTDMISQVINGDKGVFVRQAKEVWSSRKDENSDRSNVMLSPSVIEEMSNDDESSIKTITKRSIGLEPSSLAYLPLKSNHFAILNSPGTLCLNLTNLTFKPFKGANIDIKLSNISAIRKTTSIRVGVEVSSGLVVEWTNEQDEINVLKFSNVARRDDAFNHLLACSKKIWVND